MLRICLRLISVCSVLLILVPLDSSASDPQPNFVVFLADDLGWGKLVTLRSHWVPGHHFTMMTGPNATVLADKVESLLRSSADGLATDASQAMGTRLSSNS